MRDDAAVTPRRRGAALVCLPVAALLAVTACSEEGEDGSDDVTAEAPTTVAPTTEPPDEDGDEGAPGEDGTTAPGPDDDADDEPGAQRPVEVTLAAAGDVLAHTWVNNSANRYAGGGEGAYDFRPMFADVAALLSDADLALCHLETPLSPGNTDLTVADTMSFNTPREMADALADAGFDGCDLASNHTLDRGVAGLSATEEVLRDAGLGSTGPTADEGRAGEPEVYEVDGVSVAHLAYTYTYPNSGEPTTYVPDEAPWLVEASWPNIGAEGILDQASAAREDGADFVVASMHWGAEYQSTPTEQQREMARELLESDAVDLILGTHVHVIQPCEQINGKHVLYGLGNFLSNQSPLTAPGLLPETQDGMVATVTLSRDEEGTVTTAMTYQPTHVEITMDPAPATHVIRLATPETYPEAWERTTSAVDLLGGCGAGPMEP